MSAKPLHIFPFNTEKETTTRGFATYNTIAERLAALNPKILIKEHIAQRERQKAGQPKDIFSTLEAFDSTLDGIDFVAKEPTKLARALDAAKDEWGDKALTSMKEDPDHWALKLSFGKTVGTGWREVWREAPYSPPTAELNALGTLDNERQIRFGTMGSFIRYTALHCAVDEISGKSNIHIDENGFVLRMPWGVGLTPNFPSHIFHELLVKTILRDLLAGKKPDGTIGRIVSGVFRRTSLLYPDASNGYAGLKNDINRFRQVHDPIDGVLTAARLAIPKGVTFDLYDSNDSDRFKVQVAGSWLNGDLAITLSIGGRWK